MNTHQHSRAFTLIELLVVITIIGVLASIGVIMYGKARAQARDTKRVEDLQEVAKALETYRNEKGRYPSTCSGGVDDTSCSQGSWWGVCNYYGNKEFTGTNGWVPELAPDYIARLPSDPKPNIAAGFCYLYNSNGNNYSLLAHQTMETVCDGSDADTLKDPGDDCNSQNIQQLDRLISEDQPTIAVYTPGARLW